MCRQSQSCKRIMTTECMHVNRQRRKQSCKAASSYSKCFAYFSGRQHVYIQTCIQDVHTSMHPSMPACIRLSPLKKNIRSCATGKLKTEVQSLSSSLRSPADSNIHKPPSEARNPKFQVSPTCWAWRGGFGIDVAGLDLSWFLKGLLL